MVEGTTSTSCPDEYSYGQHYQLGRQGARLVRGNQVGGEPGSVIEATRGPTRNRWMVLLGLVGVPLAMIAAYVATGVLVVLIDAALLLPWFSERPHVSGVIVSGLLTAPAVYWLVRWQRGRSLATDASAPTAPSRSRWTEWWPEAAAGIASVLFLTGPFLWRLGTRFHASPDALQNIGIIHAIGEAIGDWRLLPQTLPELVYPVGVDATVLDGYLPLWLGGLLTLLVSPIAAFNLLLVLASLFNAWAGARVARCFTSSGPIIAASGLCLATSPAVAARYDGHLQLVWIGVVALLFAAGIEDARFAVRPLRLGALLAVAIATSGYFALAGGILYLAALLVGPPQREWLAASRRVAGAGLGAVVLTSPLLLSRFALDRAEADAGGTAAYRHIFDLNRSEYGIDLAEAITAQPFTRFESVRADWARETIGGNFETMVHPGWLALFGLGAVLAMRRWERQAIWLGAGALTLLALGPTLRWFGHELRVDHETVTGFLPAEYFGSVPILNSIRVPGRMFLPIAVLGAAGLAMAGDRLLRRRPRWVVNVAAAAAIAVMLVTNSVSSRIASPPEGATLALLETVRTQAEEGDTVVMAPADCAGTDTRFAMLQIYHRTPIVGCTAPYLSLPWFSEMDAYFESAGLAGLRCHAERLGWFRQPQFDHGTPLTIASLEELKAQFGVRFVIVDTALYKDPLPFTDCDAFVAQALPLLERWEVADAGRYRLIDLDLTSAPAIE